MKYNTLKTTTASVAASLGLLVMAGAAQADTPQCGDTYTVKSGDSLSQIARDVYGSARDFQILYSANSATIGANPGLISVGMRLTVPCLDAPTTTASAELVDITPVTGVDALPAPQEEIVRIVTATGWAPYSDEDQEQGGMITEMVNLAMTRADGSPEFQIDFINDWGAHLSPLVTDHAYDMSMPWYKPNCDVIERLGEDSQFRCNNFLWSDPLHDQVVGWYSRTGEEFTDYQQLVGMRLCRLEGFSTFFMEEHNLKEPAIELIQPVSAEECFDMLINDEVDVAILGIDTSEGAILSLNLQDAVILNEGLNTLLTNHAVISNTNPNGQEYIDMLNSGLQDIRDSGEWFEILRRHLTEFRTDTRS